MMVYWHAQFLQQCPHKLRCHMFQAHRMVRQECDDRGNH